MRNILRIIVNLNIDNVAQHIEDVKTCANQEVTLSFWVLSLLKLVIKLHRTRSLIKVSNYGGSFDYTDQQTGGYRTIGYHTISWERYTQLQPRLVQLLVNLYLWN